MGEYQWCRALHAELALDARSHERELRDRFAHATGQLDQHVLPVDIASVVALGLVRAASAS